jgi:hypothetical protein
VLNQAAESLLPREARVSGPATPFTENLRLLFSLASVRPGFYEYHEIPDDAAGAVNGLFLAHFDDGETELIRADKAGMWYDEGSEFDPIVDPDDVMLTGDETDTWCFAMVARAGAESRANQMFTCNGVDDVYKYTGGGDDAETMDDIQDYLKGAKTIIGHRGRALFGNVIDQTLAGTPRKTTRVYYSIVGDPETITGLGGGFVDLNDDAYPIVAGATIGGNVCIFKGDSVGGSIVVGTPTGIVQAPYRWDTINTNGIGVLCPRTLAQITPDLYFFVGQDGFYLYDGARGILPVATEITSRVVSRITPSSINLAHAIYLGATKEMLVYLPTDGSTYPNETWVLQLEERRVYGPYRHGTALTASSLFATTGQLTWSDLSAYGTWEGLRLAFKSWASMLGQASARSFMYGASDGRVAHDDNGATQTDFDNAITGTYTTAAIIPTDMSLPDGRILDEHTMLTLHEVAVQFKDIGPWVPSVEVSLDGGDTWTTISDGSVVGNDSPTNRVMTKRYYTLLPSTWHQVRVTGNQNMQLWGLTLEFMPSGSNKAHE